MKSAAGQIFVDLKRARHGRGMGFVMQELIYMEYTTLHTLVIIIADVKNVASGGESLVAC